MGTYFEKIEPGDEIVRSASEIARFYGILSDVSKKPHGKLVAKWLSTRPNYRSIFYHGEWGGRFFPVYRRSFYESHMQTLLELLSQEKPAGEITIQDRCYRYFLQEHKGA